MANVCRYTNKACSVLGSDPALWSKFEVLPGIPALADAFDSLEAAIRHAAAGEVAKARANVAEIDSVAIRNWYVEHAQVAGTHRIAILGRQRRPEAPAGLDRPYPTRTMETAVLRRDGFRCRYCQRRVLSRQVLKAFHAVVGDDAFQMGTTNATTHGAALAFRAVADHVVPRTRGGKTTPDNLVTACYPCNFGKAEYSIDELRLEQPRAAVVDAWDGLEGLVPALRAPAHGCRGAGRTVPES